MSDDRDLLEQAERQFPPPEGAYESLLRRRSQIARRRRIGAAALALVLMAAATVVVVVSFGGHERPPEPARPSPRIGVESIGRVQLAWTARVGGPAGSPVAADGHVFVGTLDGKLYAFPQGCRGDGGTCRPSWVGVTHGALGFASPAVAGGSVFVGSNGGSLYAFPEACGTGGVACRPTWTFRSHLPLGNSSPAVADGTVFVVSDRLYAVDAASGQLRWTAPVDARSSSLDASSPAVTGGMVFATSSAGKLFAFPTACGQGGAVCRPRWVAHLPVTDPSRPVVAGDTVIVRDGNEILAFPAACETGGASCPATWTGRVPSAVPVAPAIGGSLVYVASNDGRVFAFEARCGVGGTACRPRWVLHRAVLANAEPAPLASHGVLFVLWGSISAFRPGCSGAACRPLWEYGPWGAHGGAAVSDGGVFVVIGNLGLPNGTLLAFELPTPSRT